MQQQLSQCRQAVEEARAAAAAKAAELEELKGRAPKLQQQLAQAQYM
jgi:hypothetical protein